MLKVSKLVKRYGDNLAVSDISFSVTPGEIYGLLGPNGAGKSTTINIITGLIRKDGGTVTVGGMDLDKSLNQVKYLLGVVPQDLAIYNDLTAYQNVSFFGGLYGLKGAELKRQAMETLALVGLEDKAKSKVKTFSGGMKRRLNIACGLVHRPKMLILDEPTVGIDPQSRNHIMESILKLNKDGMTILYTTHYMEEAEQLCNRIAIMDMGQIVAQGNLAELRGLIEEHWFINLKVKETPPIEALRKVPGVEQIDVSGNALRFRCINKHTQLRDILNVLAEREIEIQDMATEEPNLEDVFLTLTGKRLRD
ncbi:MAG: ATP-binding cassette domain-containing protein [Christensenellales bacterium]|jgi:ABC-2 type transport system ATP-binding protein